MVKNVRECLMCPQCLLCRGLTGERKTAVLGHWGGDDKSLVDYPESFALCLPRSLTAGSLVDLGTLRLFVVPLFRSMIEIIRQGFLT